MIFSKHITFAFLFASILNISNSFSQQSSSIKNDRLNADTLLLAMNTKSILTNDNEIVIETPSALPASKLYRNHWNNKDVKLNNEKMFDKNATYILTLVNENENKFVFPYKGKVISPFGFRGRRIHAGTDIKLNMNDEVVAAFDGVVRMAKRYSGYGNLVVIRHANGLETCYGHLNKIKVKVNQEVKAGDLIGLGGRTGRASTTHLHFETRFLGDAFNSQKLLDYDNFTLKADTFIIDKNTFMKAKKFVYKKNKRGKRVKVYINNDDDENENTNVATNTIAVSNSVADSTPKQTSEIFLVYNDITKKVDTLTTSIEPVNEPIKTKITSKVKASKKTNTKSAKPVIYKVRNGDTLSRIAKKNGTTVSAICKLNKIDENAVLSLGKKLKIK